MEISVDTSVVKYIATFVQKTFKQRMDISIDSCSKVNEFTITFFSKGELHGHFYKHLCGKEYLQRLSKRSLSNAWKFL